LIIELGDIWSMSKRISGKSKVTKIPALIDGGTAGVMDKEKAEMLGLAFVTVHSGDHLIDMYKNWHSEKIRM